MATYLTGDCHGDFYKIEFFCRYHKTSRDDTMILLGDVGVNYFLNERDSIRKQLLAELPLTFLCIHGNHEARPGRIATYEQKVWHEGVVYYEKEYPNLLFAKDGEIYQIDGKRMIAIGGAYSVDKFYRISIGAPWFDDEQPSAEIKQYVQDQLKRCDWTVDYVLSHTCPLLFEPTDLFLSSIDQSKVDQSTEEWMSMIEKKMHYQTWYFGHFHGNRTYIDARMLFEEIIELGSDDFVQRVGRPKYNPGEMVMWNIEEEGETYECYGRIRIVDAYGTFGQSREVSYDIEGPNYRNPDEKICYKHIVESQLQGMNELKAGE